MYSIKDFVGLSEGKVMGSQYFGRGSRLKFLDNFKRFFDTICPPLNVSDFLSKCCGYDPPPGWVPRPPRNRQIGFGA